VDSTELLLRCRKRRDDIADLCETTLNSERLAARSVDVGDGLIGILLGGRAVIVNANSGAVSCECVADEAAKILCAASHQDDLFFQWLLEFASRGNEIFNSSLTIFFSVCHAVNNSGKIASTLGNGNGHFPEIFRTNFVDD